MKTENDKDFLANPIIARYLIFGSSFSKFSPLDSYFKAVSGPDDDILSILVPKVEHVGIVDSNNGVSSFETCSLSR